MDKKEKNEDISSFALFLTFLIASFLLHYFPQLLNNVSWVNRASKLLLIFGIFFIATIKSGDEKKEKSYGDFGVGLGILVTYIAFINSFENIVYKFFMLFLLIFGLFGTISGLYKPFKEKIDSKNSRYKDNIDTEEHPFFYVSFNVMISFLIRALETLAALVAILEFTGIQWRRF